MTEDEFRNGGVAKPKSLADKIDEVTAVAASPGNAHADDYMRGMANGLLLAQAIVHDKKPVYIEPETVFAYSREAEKTCSIIFNPQNVDAGDIASLLNRVIWNAEAMNVFKKLFFRGRSPADMMVDQPTRDASMGPLLEGCTADEINIIHGIIGIITEAGEMAELLKAFFEGRPFDCVHLLEEGGDVEWYQHRILAGIHATADMRDKANIDKLHGRHGEAFNVFRDANRNLGLERGKLEIAAAPLLSAMEGHDADGLAKIEDAIMPELGPVDLAAIPPRARNQPPLPPGVNVGTVERHVKTNVGDCEGMDC